MFNYAPDDSHTMIVEKKSPNQDERLNGIFPTVLILHYTGLKNQEEADQLYMTPGCVAPHYMINESGAVTNYVLEEKRSWHAGIATWDGMNDLNSHSIGIEICNGGHKYGLPEYPVQQITRLIELIHHIRSRWDIPNHYILGQSDVAPGRKIDPGENFPWRKLHEAGIGLMPQEKVDLQIPIEQAFRQFGYNTAIGLDIIKTEFCRHYLYDKFTTATEENIRSAIACLLKQKPSASARLAFNAES